MCCMCSVVFECLTSFIKSCGRCGLIIVNSILLLCGVGLILLATMYVKKLHDIEKFLNIRHTDNICLIAGVVVFLIGLVGYISVFTNSRIILMLFIIATIGVIIALFVCLPLVEKSIRKIIDNCSYDIFKKTYEKAVDENDQKTIIAWHALETKFKCCGFNGPEDWRAFMPPSCCGFKIESVNNLAEGQLCSDPYKTGCIDVIKKQAKGLTPVVMAVYIVIIALEVWQLISLIVRFIFV